MTDKKDIIEMNEDDIEGEGGGQPIEESYATILETLGVDTREMSIEDIENMIHQYSQEGRLKGAKVIDINTGKSRQTFKKKQSNQRTITVKHKQDEPMSTDDFEKRKAYEESSKKQDKPQPPRKPFSPPKPGLPR